MGSSNILRLILQAMRISRERVVYQFIEIYGFGGGASLTVGCVNVDLVVGSILSSYSLSCHQS